MKKPVSVAITLKSEPIRYRSLTSTYSARAADADAFSRAVDDASVDDAANEAITAASAHASGLESLELPISSQQRDDASDDEPFVVPISSVVTNVVLQAAHNPQVSQGHVDEPDVEYGTKSGVRCLICQHVFHDKSVYNRHCSRSVNCQVRRFQHIHKRINHDEAAAAAAASAFTIADAEATRCAGGGV